MPIKICIVGELMKYHAQWMKESHFVETMMEILSADTTLPAQNIRPHSVPIFRGTLPYLTI